MTQAAFFSSGYSRAPEGVLVPRAPWRSYTLTFTSAAIRRVDGSVTLVDCPWSRAQAGRAFDLPTLNSWWMGERVARGQSTVERLAQLGVPAGDVRDIVLTHLHYDHVGGLEDFPDARILAPAAEIERARRAGFLRGYPSSVRARLDAMVALELDGPPALEMPRSLDLYGDGAVVLLDTAGHTPGSISVAIRVGARTLVHVGDAVYASPAYADGAQTPLSPLARFTVFDETRYRDTLARLRRLADAPSGPVLVPAHCPAALARVGTLWSVS